ncbi:MAG TPA: hypothetical protein VL576_01140 [Candidatus Paceibacterota bacterium]|nr:hypothetical protein [Candidatus Paceibacterota bacterium]
MENIFGKKEVTDSTLNECVDSYLRRVPKTERTERVAAEEFIQENSASFRPLPAWLTNKVLNALN